MLLDLIHNGSEDNSEGEVGGQVGIINSCSAILYIYQWNHR